MPAARPEHLRVHILGFQPGAGTTRGGRYWPGAHRPGNPVARVPGRAPGGWAPTRIDRRIRPRKSGGSPVSCLPVSVEGREYDSGAAIMAGGVVECAAAGYRPERRVIGRAVN